MNRFTVDFSSSPASEQLPSNSPHQQRRNIFTLPDNVASTTPAAPPPSQIFGSSQFGTGVSKLQFTRGSEAFDSSAPLPQASQQSRNEASNRPKSRLFETSTQTYTTNQDDQDYTDNMMEDEEDNYGEDQDPLPRTRNIAPSLLKFSTNSMRNSFRKSAIRNATSNSRSHLPRKGRYDVVPGLARGIVKRLGNAQLNEPDDIILGTEDLVRNLDDECQRRSNESSRQMVIIATVQELVSQWRRRSRHGTSTGQNSIGPDARSATFEKAQYLAALLLELRHPARLSADAESLIFTDGRGDCNTRPMPEVLLEWLDDNHVNYRPLFDQVANTTPAPSANELYWDAIETFTLRGKFEEVMELLRRGDLNHAVVDTPDGTQNANFSGIQLQQAEDAVYRARQLINTCPALQSGDWCLNGQDWSIYRKQLESEIEHLAEQVSSQDDEAQPESNNVGLIGKPSAKTGLPFIIYQRLKTVYSIMLGEANEIVGLAQDWVEASIFLTVWWIPTDETTVAQWSFDVSKANNPQLEEIDPYLKRLSDSFLCVTDPDSESSFQLNTMDVIDVGLGAVMQGDIQACLRILSTLSLCVTSTIAEIGTWAGWIASNASSVGLDQDDLMVLNFGSNDIAIKKDDILEKYARALFTKDTLHTANSGFVEGWELSFSILSRLDDQEQMHKSISELIQDLPVTDQERTAKLVEICEQLGLETEGRKVSENFADTLVNNGNEYGTALLCYARAHAENKVRQLIDLLNSYCLVQSKVYPPENELDPALAQLVSSPKTALQNIADADPKAAEILQFYLVGYACLRRFYTLRDDQTEIQNVKLRPIARRKAAARALVAAINSAADSIYGGLYDPNRQSAIQVDGLLTLFGEATALTTYDGQERILSSEQMYALLAAVEDLQIVSERVYSAAEECMEASLRNYHGSVPPSPHAMLKKSFSSGTNSNFSFSMMGSEMLARSEESLGGKSMGSTVMVGQGGGDDTQRGWDWRGHFKDQATTGADVLKHLRMCIAKELSIANVEEGSINM